MAHPVVSPSPAFPVGLPFNSFVEENPAGTGSRPPKAPPSNQLLFALSESPFDARSALPASLAKRPFSISKSPPRQPQSSSALKIERLTGLPRPNHFARRLIDDEVDVAAAHSASALCSGRADRGIDPDLLDKVVKLAQADVKRKKMEVELYVETLARKADSVEEMLRGLAGAGMEGVPKGNSGKDYAAKKITPQKTRKKTPKPSPKKKKKAEKTSVAIDGVESGSGVSFQVIDQYQPPKAASTVAATAPSSAAADAAPTAAKPPFVPAGVNPPASKSTPRGTGTETAKTNPKSDRRETPTQPPQKQRNSGNPTISGVEVDEEAFQAELEGILRQMSSMVEVASASGLGGRRGKEEKFRGLEENEIKRRETRVNKVAVSISRDIYSLRRETVDLQRSLDSSTSTSVSSASLRSKLLSIHRAFLRHVSSYFSQLPFVVHAGPEHKHLLSEMSNLFYLSSLCTARCAVPSDSTKELGRRVFDGLKTISEDFMKDESGGDVGKTPWKNLNDRVPTSSPPTWDNSSAAQKSLPPASGGRTGRGAGSGRSRPGSGRPKSSVLKENNTSSSNNNNNINNKIRRKPSTRPSPSRPSPSSRATQSDSHVRPSSTYSEKTFTSYMRQRPPVSPERYSSPDSPTRSALRRNQTSTSEHSPRNFGVRFPGESTSRDQKTPSQRCPRYSAERYVSTVDHSSSRLNTRGLALPASVDQGAEREVDAVDGGKIEREMREVEKREEREKPALNEMPSFLLREKLDLARAKQQKQQQQQPLQQQKPQRRLQQQLSQQQGEGNEVLLGEIVNILDRDQEAQEAHEDEDFDNEAFLASKFNGEELLRKIERLEREENAIRQKWLGNFDLGNFDLSTSEKYIPTFSTTFAATTAPTSVAAATIPESNAVESNFSFVVRDLDNFDDNRSSCQNFPPLILSKAALNVRSNLDSEKLIEEPKTSIQSSILPNKYQQSKADICVPVTASSTSLSTAVELFLPEAQIRNIFACRRLNEDRWRRSGFPDSDAAFRAIEVVSEKLIDEALRQIGDELEQFATSLADALVDSELKNQWGIDGSLRNKVDDSPVLSERHLSSVDEVSLRVKSEDENVSRHSNLAIEECDSLKEMLFSQLESLSHQMRSANNHSGNNEGNPSEMNKSQSQRTKSLVAENDGIFPKEANHPSEKVVEKASLDDLQEGDSNEFSSTFESSSTTLAKENVVFGTAAGNGPLEGDEISRTSERRMHSDSDGSNALGDGVDELEDEKRKNDASSHCEPKSYASGGVEGERLRFSNKSERSRDPISGRDSTDCDDLSFEADSKSNSNQLDSSKGRNELIRSLSSIGD